MALRVPFAPWSHFTRVPRTLRLRTDIGVAWLNRHWQPILLVLLGCAIGQLGEIHQPFVVWQFPDAKEYIADAQNIQWIDAYRTPGYPLFIATVFHLTGRQHLWPVVVLQVLLTIAAILGIYVLAYRICSRRWFAAFTAALIGANIYIANWERAILTEDLTIVLLVAQLIIFERLLRYPRWWLFGAFALVSFYSIMVRPFCVWIALVLLVILVATYYRMRQLRRVWRKALIAFCMIYGLVAGYAAANAVFNNYLGLSYVSSVNLFGVVLKYHMQDLNTNPQYAMLQHDADQYVASGQYSGWIFIYQHPNPAYSANHYRMLTNFANGIVLHHPLTYLGNVITETEQVVIKPPLAYAPISSENHWVNLLQQFSAFEIASYVLLLPLLALFSFVWWRESERKVEIAAVLALLICAAGSVLLASADTYNEFYRLRSILDWAMILAASMAFVEVFSAMLKHNVMSENPLSHHDPRQLQMHPSSDTHSDSAQLLQSANPEQRRKFDR